MSKNEEKKPIYKKWWFWVIIVLMFFGALGSDTNPTNMIDNTITNEVVEQKEVYTIESEEIGQYGKKIILNEKTDLPTTKYLYKLPSGTYKITTTTNETIGICIVKDEIMIEESNYPESLNYVGEQAIISGNSNRIGKANITDSVELTINEDESFSLIGKGSVIFEKK